MIKKIAICLASLALIAGCSMDSNEPEPTKSDDTTDTAKVPVVETDTVDPQACPPVQPIPNCWPYYPTCTVGPFPCRTRRCWCN